MTATVTSDLASIVYAELEVPNWAPWLRFGPETLAAQAVTFPAGQIVLRDAAEDVVAALSANRIDWDGRVETLTTWDAVAGEDATYADTYEPDGNTFVLMSMNVAAHARGARWSSRVIDEVLAYAHAEGIEHVISDFRPSGFGAVKRDEHLFDMATYCAQLRADGLPRDPWLRALHRRGMQRLRLDPRAMAVRASADELDGWRRTYRPEQWWQVTATSAIDGLIEWFMPQELDRIDEIWECGETGTWFCDRRSGEAIYLETNVWGEVPLGA
jgi:GNAT superfamily N-acetyltransferase